MPTEVLYSVITFLGLCVIVLGGLWIKDIMTHRQWAVEQITETMTEVAVLKSAYSAIQSDIKEVKDLVKENGALVSRHLLIEEEFQKMVVSRLNISSPKKEA